MKWERVTKPARKICHMLTIKHQKPMAPSARPPGVLRVLEDVLCHDLFVASVGLRFYKIRRGVMQLIEKENLALPAAQL